MIIQKNMLPRVLVISSTPFSKTMNNGKTLSSFFRQYDKKAIAQFSFSGGDCDEDICDNYFFLTNGDVLHGRKGRQYTAKEIVRNEGRQGEKRGFVGKIFHAFSQRRIPLTMFIKNSIRGKADYSKAYKWIEDFKPDVVFFQGFSMAYGYDFVFNVCEKWRLPLILELTDDYTHRLYPLSLIGKINHSTYMDRFTRALTMASNTIVISDKMKQEYSAKYGGHYLVMMNTIQIPENLETYQQKRNENDYVYAGNLLLNRWKVLRNLGKALHKENPKAVLNIYTPDIPPSYILRRLTKEKNIRYGGRLTKDELKNRLEICEYVVHVESFDKKNRMITRLSMSTKIPEYLASGAKLIAIGPEEVASMDCLIKNNLAHCITKPYVKSIAESLKSGWIYYDHSIYVKNFLKYCASEENYKKIIECIIQCKKRR